MESTPPVARTPIIGAAPNAVADYAFPWQPDRGDGRYCNPILYADYSDPDVVRVGEDFYLTASSFNCIPGLPILHSKDLVNWRIINHALKKLPDPRYFEVQPGCGVWAPSIRFHAGKFWIFFPTPDEGIYVTLADHPAGTWSEPHLVQEGKGLIDPCPLWDDDGKAYLVHAYAGSRSGIKHMLRVRPMAPDGTKLLDEGRIVFHDPERHPTLEGPKFLKRDGWYYILAPAGGVETGWQVALRSRHIYGPYEDKIVLQQGNTKINGPHQGALVDAPNGDWWFIHFQDVGVYGRITHLQPVTWDEDWPVIGTLAEGKDVGEPVSCFRKPVHETRSLPSVPQTTDEFDKPELGLQWQWHANPCRKWSSLTVRPGWLRLFPQPGLHEKAKWLPNLLLQKFPSRSFSVEALMDFAPARPGEEGGLIVAGESWATLAIESSQAVNQVVLRIDGVSQTVCGNVPHLVRLRVAVAAGGLCTFTFVCDGSVIEIPRQFQAAKGKWIGAKIGVYSMKTFEEAPSGYLDVDYFRFA
jgi:beta-xylosidase